MLERPMNELALFAGAGGGLLASGLLGHRIVCAVEKDPYCQRILVQRQNDRILPGFPIWDDVCTFDGNRFREHVDLVSGGFPCQPFSTAARGANIKSKDLWYEMRRVVTEVRPKFVFAENVTFSAINHASDDLRKEGYCSKVIRKSAADMGADHVRSRFWLFAYSDMYSEFCLPKYAETSGMSELCNGVWQTIPDQLRMDDGVANRMDRIKAAGNGQVPLVAMLAFLEGMNWYARKENRTERT